MTERVLPRASWASGTRQVSSQAALRWVTRWGLAAVVTTTASVGGSLSRSARVRGTTSGESRPRASMVWVARALTSWRNSTCSTLQVAASNLATSMPCMLTSLLTPKSTASRVRIDQCIPTTSDVAKASWMAASLWSRLAMVASKTKRGARSNLAARGPRRPTDRNATAKEAASSTSASTPTQTRRVPRICDGRHDWAGFTGCQTSTSGATTCAHRWGLRSARARYRKNVSTHARFTAPRAKVAATARSRFSCFSWSFSTVSFKVANAAFLRSLVFRACSRFRSRSRATRSSALSSTPAGARGRADRRGGFRAVCCARSSSRSSSSSGGDPPKLVTTLLAPPAPPPTPPPPPPPPRG
mmetsp:Transcript_35877/g.114956  ORF Transcript_35877/g.114956 Transcript_35877/m.114956 type:complete len:357 (+) Transcript_35877:1500-2570(+)